MGTPLSLLQWLGTHYGRNCEQLFGPRCSSQDFAYTISIFFRGNNRGPQLKRSRWWDPDTKFRLAGQRSHCFCFTKRPLISTVFSVVPPAVWLFPVTSPSVQPTTEKSIDNVASTRHLTASIPRSCVLSTFLTSITRLKGVQCLWITR